MRITTSILFAVTVILCLFLKQTEEFLLQHPSISWSAAQLAPKILLFVLLVFTSFVLFKQFGNKFGIVASSLLVALAIASMYLFTPIYLDDYKKTGDTQILTPDTNSVLNNLFEEEPDFDGLFVILNPDCEHCINSGIMLNKIKQRNKEIDVSVLIFTTKDTVAQGFIQAAKLENPKYYLAQNERDVYNLTLGGFPCFFYIKDRKIKQRWQVADFGYPAIDWVESQVF